jgi:hypothetical protein
MRKCSPRTWTSDKERQFLVALAETCNVKGLAAVVRSSGSTAVYRNGAWEVGKLRGSEVAVDGVKVVGAQQAAIPAPAGGTTADVEARAAIGAILAALRSHGLILS